MGIGINIGAGKVVIGTGGTSLVSFSNDVTEVEINNTGLQGPQGAGVSDGDKGDINIVAGVWQLETIQFDFASPLSVWLVNHNKGRRVQADVYTLGGTEIAAQVDRLNDNQTQISFDEPTVGYVIIQ